MKDKELQVGLNELINKGKDTIDKLKGKIRAVEKERDEAIKMRDSVLKGLKYNSPHCWEWVEDIIAGRHFLLYKRGEFVQAIPVGVHASHNVEKLVRDNQALENAVTALEQNIEVLRRRLERAGIYDI